MNGSRSGCCGSSIKDQLVKKLAARNCSSVRRPGKSEFRKQVSKGRRPIPGRSGERFTLEEFENVVKEHDRKSGITLTESEIRELVRIRAGYDDREEPAEVSVPSIHLQAAAFDVIPRRRFEYVGDRESVEAACGSAPVYQTHSLRNLFTNEELYRYRIEGAAKIDTIAGHPVLEFEPQDEYMANFKNSCVDKEWMSRIQAKGYGLHPIPSIVYALLLVSLRHGARVTGRCVRSVLTKCVADSSSELFNLDITRLSRIYGDYYRLRFKRIQVRLVEDPQNSSGSKKYELFDRILLKSIARMTDVAPIILAAIENNLSSWDRDKLATIIRRSYCGIGQRKIQDFLDNCPEVQISKAKTGERRSCGCIVATRPMERLEFDLTWMNVGSLDREEFWLLVVIDCFSKFCWAFILYEDPTADNVWCQMEKIFEADGNSLLLQSDNGTNLCRNKLARELCRLLHIQIVLSSPYWPQTNGQVENMNAHIKKDFVKAANMYPGKDNAFILRKCLAAYNNSPHYALGYQLFTPFCLHYGRVPQQYFTDPMLSRQMPCVTDEMRYNAEQNLKQLQAVSSIESSGWDQFFVAESKKVDNVSEALKERLIEKQQMYAAIFKRKEQYITDQIIGKQKDKSRRFFVSDPVVIFCYYHGAADPKGPSKRRLVGVRRIGIVRGVTKFSNGEDRYEVEYWPANERPELTNVDWVRGSRLRLLSRQQHVARQLKMIKAPNRCQSSSECICRKSPDCSNRMCHNCCWKNGENWCKNRKHKWLTALKTGTLFKEGNGFRVKAVKLKRCKMASRLMNIPGFRNRHGFCCGLDPFCSARVKVKGSACSSCLKLKNLI